MEALLAAADKNDADEMLKCLSTDNAAAAAANIKSKRVKTKKRKPEEGDEKKDEKKTEEEEEDNGPVCAYRRKGEAPPEDCMACGS